MIEENKMPTPLTQEFIEELKPDVLFQALVGMVGLKKTKEIITYYLELEEDMEYGELKND